ncbi:MAG: SCO family protein [Candidatus Thiodiazotropha sp. (ex Epidulcina cf. delphinae)]|nr:SCO family protein [Candidatus Thiodiazotropha sp. (ex Epidulcina cf. delphinae)]
MISKTMHGNRMSSRCRSAQRGFICFLSCLVSAFSIHADEAVVNGAGGIEDGIAPLPFKMDCIAKPLKAQQTPADRFTLAMNRDHGSDHAHHKMMMEKKDFRVSQAEYPIPDVLLTSHKGEQTRLPDLLNSDQPVMLNFIFTTCTTICPVLSASFNQIQQLLRDDQAVSMISITIDPEYDTPEQLMKYANRFEAGGNWRFFTGSYQDVVTVEKAFDIFRGSKMNHEPITLIRGREDDLWTRIDGLASAEDIVKAYQKIVEAIE